MKRIVSLILFAMAICHVARAQQDPLSTMFMTNPFVLNPAIAGTNKYFQVTSQNRFQWVGFADAPITNSLSVYGPTVKYPMGWGANISYDVYGTTSTGTVHGAYAYQYNINEEMNLAAGISIGIMQKKFNLGEITMPDEGDPVMDAKETYYIPDANVGFYFWSSTYHAGFVFRHILNNRINLYSSTSRDSSSRLKPHLYLTGGYKYYINRDWAIEPSLVLKKVWSAPFQLDVNARVWYQNKVWGGLSYRTQEALSVMIGYTYDRKIYIGYSYDLVLNPLFSHNFGSHEIMLGYRFKRHKRLMKEKIHNFCFKAAGLILILLLLFSCRDNSRRTIIPEKKFIAFLVDLHLVEALGNQTKHDPDLVYHIDSASLYGSVFRKHNITLAMFDSTMFFYSLRPEKFQKIYNNVTAELKHREENTLKEQKEQELAESEILYRSDTVYVFPQRGPDRIEIDVPIRGPGIYAVTARVKMIRDDASIDPRMTVYFYRNDTTANGVRLPFKEIRYLSRDGEPKEYRAVQNLQTSSFTHIRGFIANYSNKDSSFRRNMVVQDILVTKRPLANSGNLTLPPKRERP